MKKTLLLLLSVIGLITLFGCKEGKEELYYGEILTPGKYSIDSMNFKSYVASGMQFFHPNNYDAYVPGINYDGPNPDVFTINITSEEFAYINSTFNYYSPIELIDMGFLTLDQGEELKAFATSLEQDKAFTFYLVKTFEDTDSIVIVDTGGGLHHTQDYHPGSMITFPLLTITNDEIIAKACLASNHQEISSTNLNWEVGGIFIHSYVKSNGLTNVKMFLIDLEGNLSWFEVIL